MQQELSMIETEGRLEDWMLMISYIMLLLLNWFLQRRVLHLMREDLQRKSMKLDSWKVYSLVGMHKVKVYNHVSFLLKTRSRGKSRILKKRSSLSTWPRTSLKTRNDVVPAAVLLLFCCWIDSSNAMIGAETGISVWDLFVSATDPRSRIWSKLVPSTKPFSFLTGLSPPWFSTVVIRGLLLRIIDVNELF